MENKSFVDSFAPRWRELPGLEDFATTKIEAIIPRDLAIKHNFDLQEYQPPVDPQVGDGVDQPGNYTHVNHSSGNTGSSSVTQRQARRGDRRLQGSTTTNNTGRPSKGQAGNETAPLPPDRKRPRLGRGELEEQREQSEHELAATLFQGSRTLPRAPRRFERPQSPPPPVRHFSDDDEYDDPDIAYIFESDLIDSKLASGFRTLASSSRPGDFGSSTPDTAEKHPTTGAPTRLPPRTAQPGFRTLANSPHLGDFTLGLSNISEKQSDSKTLLLPGSNLGDSRSRFHVVNQGDDNNITPPRTDVTSVAIVSRDFANYARSVYWNSVLPLQRANVDEIMQKITTAEFQAKIDLGIDRGAFAIHPDRLCFVSRTQFLRRPSLADAWSEHKRSSVGKERFGDPKIKANRVLGLINHLHDDNLQEITGSHLCHHPTCIGYLHVDGEDHVSNISRNNCAALARQLATDGADIPIFCGVDRHHPPCRTASAAYSTKEHFIASWMYTHGFPTFDDILLKNTGLDDLCQELLDTKVRSWKLVFKEENNIKTPYMRLVSSMTLADRIGEKKSGSDDIIAPPSRNTRSRTRHLDADKSNIILQERATARNDLSDNIEVNDLDVSGDNIEVIDLDESGDVSEDVNRNDPGDNTVHISSDKLQPQTIRRLVERSRLLTIAVHGARLDGADANQSAVQLTGIQMQLTRHFLQDADCQNYIDTAIDVLKLKCLLCAGPYYSGMPAKYRTPSRPYGDCDMGVTPHLAMKHLDKHMEGDEVKALVLLYMINHIEWFAKSLSSGNHTLFEKMKLDLEKGRYPSITRLKALVG